MSHPAEPILLPAAIARAENLPSLPAVAVEVLRLTQGDDSTIDDLARALQNDPALAAKLLQLANSSLFNLGQEVTTLQRATMVLGLKTVKLMSLSFSLATSLPRSGAGAFDFPTYWRRSLVAAVAGRSLARLVGSRCGDEAFLCGLLSHIGQLVLSQCLTEEYGEVLAGCGERWPTLRAEERLLGFHSADVAAALLAQWGLPESIRTPITYLARPGELPADTPAELCDLTFLMAVDGLVVELLCGGRERAAGKLYDLMEQRFGVGRREFDAWIIGLESGIRETAAMLTVELPADLDHAGLVEAARREMSRISIGATADLRQAERRADDLWLRNRELLARATRDALTGLPNRAAFDETLAGEVAARRDQDLPRCLGLLMIDVDRFKGFNDEHGHLAGDAVLGVVGEVLDRETRKGDLAARYGGEEFAVLLPATTPGVLRAIAERVRRAVEARVVPFEGRDLRVTDSVGGACVRCTDLPDMPAALIRAADRCLYRAKDEGRNRVLVLPEPIDLPDAPEIER